MALPSSITRSDSSGSFENALSGNVLLMMMTKAYEEHRGWKRTRTCSARRTGSAPAFLPQLVPVHGRVIHGHEKARLALSCTWYWPYPLPALFPAGLAAVHARETGVLLVQHSSINDEVLEMI